MLDLKLIIKNLEEVKSKLSTRGFDTLLIDEVAKLASERSKVMVSLQGLEAKRNELSKSIGIIKGKGEDVSSVLKDVANIKKDIDGIKDTEVQINEKITKILLTVPNIPNKNTPLGADENENVLIAEHDKLGRGKVTGVKPHYEIGVELDIVDFERAVKLSGARFWSYTGLGARLVRALESFMLDTHARNNYKEVVPPLIVNAKTMQGTGQLPKFEDDLFKIEGSDSYLIPTAEVPLTNFYANEIVDLAKPIMLTAYTPCFRKEAGSGGKDMKGLIRSHQFNKVELVKIITTEQRDEEFKKTVKDAKGILEALELPFRELRLCTGDLGFSAEETIDLEVWIPSENKYREISSVSLVGDFQGRRASIRYKDESGKSVYASSINGSALAIDRAIAAILENYQNEDGSITIPNVLVPYMNCEVIDAK